jgi:hypothetical protein
MKKRGFRMLPTAVLVCSSLRRRPPPFHLGDAYSRIDDYPPRHELAALDEVALDHDPVAVYLAALAPRRGAP